MARVLHSFLYQNNFYFFKILRFCIIFFFFFRKPNNHVLGILMVLKKCITQIEKCTNPKCAADALFQNKHIVCKYH